MLSAIFFCLISITKLRTIIINAIPDCKVKMQIGQLALITSILYLLLKIATIFSKKIFFLNYVVISVPRKMIFVKNLKLIIKLYTVKLNDKKLIKL
ncbi:MAG: hypothetical protein SPLM_07490 [Spiroplasma phoeniceum]